VPAGLRNSPLPRNSPEVKQMVIVDPVHEGTIHRLYRWTTCILSICL
jgi:hypothetical protein